MMGYATRPASMLKAMSWPTVLSAADALRLPEFSAQ